MTLNFERTSETDLRVFATGRDGSESYDNSFELTSSAIDAFRFYASNLVSGDNRQPYFNNFEITASQASVTLDGSEGFRMLSVPATATFSNYLDPIWTQGADVGANTSNGDPNVFLWDNTSSDGSSTNWDGLNDLTVDIAAGTGFLVYVYEDDEFGVDGEFPKTLSVNGTEHGETSPAVNQEDGGFTLLGNPFASPINWDQVDSDDLTGTIYVYEPETEWRANAEGFGEHDGIIAPFQGFFVQSESGSPSVTFNDDAKGSGGTFYGKQIYDRNSIVRLELNGEELQSSAWLRFSESGSLDGQIRGDALELQPLSSNFAQLATKKNNGTLFDISHLPVPDSDFEVPLWVDATIGGTYSLSVTDFEYTGSESLFLVDRLKNKSLPLDGDLSYEFELESPSQKKAVANPLEVINRGPSKAVADQNEPRFVIAAGETVNSEAGADLPSELALKQNYPNPFNPTTMISYDVPEQQHVRLTVYDMLGRQVSVLVDETQSPGSHDVTWDASQLSSGVYIYRLEAGGQTLTRKMTLVK